MHCEEAERLLDAYLAALAAFYDARRPSLTRWLRSESNVDVKEATQAQLIEARRQYWTHIDECGRPERNRRPFVRGRVLRRQEPRPWAAVSEISDFGY